MPRRSKSALIYASHAQAAVMVFGQDRHYFVHSGYFEDVYNAGDPRLQCFTTPNRGKSGVGMQRLAFS